MSEDCHKAADAIERLQRERDALLETQRRFGVVQNGLFQRAEKAEAELSRLTPTEEEKITAQILSDQLRAWQPMSKRNSMDAAALLRKFVLQDND